MAPIADATVPDMLPPDAQHVPHDAASKDAEPPPDMAVPAPDAMTVPDMMMVHVPDAMPVPDMMPPVPDAAVMPPADAGPVAGPLVLTGGRLTWVAAPAGAGRVYSATESSNGVYRLRGRLRAPAGGGP
jgi:hypothetical protein